MNVSGFMLERLSAWGVRRVLGYPGDGINGLMGAFNRNGGGLRFIQERHEEIGLYDAKLDNAPVVAIVGQSARSARRRGAEPRPRHHAHSIGYSAPRVVPAERELERAAETLNAGERVALLVGNGASNAVDGVIEVAERSTRALPKHSSVALCCGRSALRHGRHRAARDQAELESDELLRHAARDRLELPLLRVSAARGPSARRTNRHRRAHARHALSMSVNLVGDALATLEALLPRLRQKPKNGWLEKNRRMERGLGEADARPRASGGETHQPQRVFWELFVALARRLHPHGRLRQRLAVEGMDRVLYDHVRDKTCRSRRTSTPCPRAMAGCSSSSARTIAMSSRGARGGCVSSCSRFPPRPALPGESRRRRDSVRPGSARRMAGLRRLRRAARAAR